ncbi:DNA gyrase subunit A [Polystyrenella longa]|uniref:DNA topoisomerase (ATP-hydrolyzing) n=1 Tax=Polystyrenella longa TaxID=2528007 RepID=A0A518CP11_9PLAN|nr:DNA topoisomerase IV subunit A [Polystyrenella longa]QDU80953.1 DNA gyrase subunit A [Polystyrenella longa]
MAKKRRSTSSVPQEQNTDNIKYVSLSQETRRRYLNYALSVITSRALPDVRDGLKPVQRRILYVMFADLRLTFDAKTRKSAKITGDTTGGYHPHGDMAVYDAMVRLAQDFTLRYPLINGQGNFGSIMGLPAAAARYTEAKLTLIAEELLNEIRSRTVDMRTNYDGTRNEPVVLPARFPNILVNGTSGIAVGMATNIPPHNLTEVANACQFLITNPEATVAQVMKYIKGPDFPLGGRIVTDRTTIRKAYEEGRGSVKVRGEWRFDKEKKVENPNKIVIYTIPYGIESGNFVNDLGDIVANRKLPQLVDVSDETNDENGLRIVLDIKPGSDIDAVMAYLYKHTNFEQNFSLNLTCLVPDEQGGTIPARLSLVQILKEFLDFRFKTITRRFEYQLEQLEKRIHILNGMVLIFKGLDRALKIIRNSSGKQDAAVKLMAEFPLDEIQTYAILELQLYRISQLEIDNINEELRQKEAEAETIRKILASPKKLWKVVSTELQDLTDKFGDKRRTSIGNVEEIVEYDPQAYIVKENTNVVVTREGWVKRVGRLQKVESTRVREGDTVLNVIPTSTLDQIIFFASDGAAYTITADQIPASSGYGEPLAKHVRLGDGVNIVAAISTDSRFTDEDFEYHGYPVPGPYLFVATERGQVLHIPLTNFRQPSTKAGRRYCRLGKGDRVVFVRLIGEAETVFLASEMARVVHFSLEDVPVLSSAGKGVRGIRLDSKDKLLGAALMARPSDTLKVMNSNDKLVSMGQTKYTVTSRGGKGVRTSMRSTFKELIPPEIELIDWATMEET